MKAGECLLHPLGTAPDSGVGVELVLCGVEVVRQMQGLPVDDLVEDALQDGFVSRPVVTSAVFGSFPASSSITGIVRLALAWSVPAEGASVTIVAKAASRSEACRIVAVAAKTCAAGLRLESRAARRDAERLRLLVTLGSGSRSEQTLGTSTQRSLAAD